jgi:hypothetical protein
MPQGHEVRTWVMTQGRNSMITCMIDLKLGGNLSPGLADKMHLIHTAQIIPLGH